MEYAVQPDRAEHGAARATPPAMPTTNTSASLDCSTRTFPGRPHERQDRDRHRGRVTGALADSVGDNSPSSLLDVVGQLVEGRRSRHAVGGGPVLGSRERPHDVQVRAPAGRLGQSKSPGRTRDSAGPTSSGATGIHDVQNPELDVHQVTSGRKTGAGVVAVVY